MPSVMFSGEVTVNVLRIKSLYSACQSGCKIPGSIRKRIRQPLSWHSLAACIRSSRVAVPTSNVSTAYRLFRLQEITVWLLGLVDNKFSMLQLFVKSIRKALEKPEKKGTNIVVRLVMWSSARLSSISPMLKLSLP